MEFFDFIIHINNYLTELAKQNVVWIYFVSFLICFCETGLILAFFLPGDSLLLAIGMFAAGKTNCLNIHWMLLLISIASILGSICNFSIGKFFGKKIFRNCFKQSYFKKTHNFYEKYGGKTIIFAPFVPIVRTFIPFLAGIIQMNYTRFFIYNTIGSVFWATTILYTSYFFSGYVCKLEFIEKYFGLLMIATLVCVPLFLGVVKVLKQRKKNKNKCN